MAHRESPASDKAPSQRQLRVGTALTVFAFLLWSGAAMAEVCDKVTGNDYWLPEGAGPVTETAIELAGILGLLVAVYFAKISFLAYLMTAVLLFRALFVVAWMVEDDIYSMAVREGCKSLPVDLIHIALLVALAIVCIWLGYRSRGRHAEAT